MILQQAEPGFLLLSKLGIFFITAAEIPPSQVFAINLDCFNFTMIVTVIAGIFPLSNLFSMQVLPETGLF